MESSNRSLQILDCTLRDGSYPIDFQFTGQDTKQLVRELEEGGIEYVEVGHGLGLNAQNVGKGSAAATDREYIEAAIEARSEAKVGMFYIPDIGGKSDLELLADSGGDFVRIGQNVTEWRNMREHIEYANDHGLKVCGNLMKSYAKSPAVVAERIQDLSDWGCDVGYIVDSAGGMLPDTVEEYISEAVEGTNGIDIGLHCHDNLNLAAANSLVAVDAGAEWIDATLGGIGRSAGNTNLEVFATILQRKGIELGIDQKHLMDVSNDVIAPMMSARNQDSLDITAGYARFHTSFLDDVLAIADKFDIDPRDLMVEVTKEDLVRAEEEVIREAASRLSASKENGELGRKTSYLEQSKRAIGFNELPRDATAFAESVTRKAKKFSKFGVVSITEAFHEVSDPEPTVVHENEQMILGNVQTSTSEQAQSVIHSISETVGTILIDRRLASESLSYPAGVEIRRFDDALAIARSISSLVDQWTDLRTPAVVVVGQNSLAERVEQVMGARGFQVSRTENPNELHMDSGVDVLIGLTDEKGSIDAPAVEALERPRLLIDAGISSFSKGAIDATRDMNVDVLRSDTRAGFISEIEGELITSELISRNIGTRLVDGVKVVAGGKIGSEGSIVVDSIEQPTTVIGIADGQGGIKKRLTESDERSVEAIKESFDIRNLDR